MKQRKGPLAVILGVSAAPDNWIQIFKHKINVKETGHVATFLHEKAERDEQQAGSKFECESSKDVARQWVDCIENEWAE